MAVFSYRNLLLSDPFTGRLIFHSVIDKYSVGDLEFAVNKKMDGSVVVDSMHNIDLFGNTGKVIEVENFDI